MPSNCQDNQSNNNWAEVPSVSDEDDRHLFMEDHHQQTIQDTQADPQTSPPGLQLRKKFQEM